LFVNGFSGNRKLLGKVEKLGQFKEIVVDDVEWGF
jgi:hypothetical protein